MRTSKIMAAAATFLLVSAPAWAEAPAAPGTISIVGKQMGAPVEGQFKKFTAQVQFDPANPAASKAAVEIDVASIDLGLEDFNQELRTKTWFDAKGHPKATFVSSAIKPLAPDRFEVSGKLTIKGKTKDVTFPMTIKPEGHTRVYSGVLPIRRNDFGIGEGEWKDTSVVADEVQIRFRVAEAAK